MHAEADASVVTNASKSHELIMAWSPFIQSVIHAWSWFTSLFAVIHSFTHVAGPPPSLFVPFVIRSFVRSFVRHSFVVVRLFVVRRSVIRSTAGTGQLSEAVVVGCCCQAACMKVMLSVGQTTRTLPPSLPPSITVIQADNLCSFVRSLFIWSVS